MVFVNLFSKYIKEIANDTDTDYADVLKSFEKSKRLQKDWKAYRDAEMKNKPYLFKPPVIERVIRFENIEPITSIALPTPTADTTIQVDKDSENSVLITELDDGGVEETKEEDTNRLSKLVQDLEINPIMSSPSQPIKTPSKSDKPKGREREKDEKALYREKLNELEKLFRINDDDEESSANLDDFELELLKRQAGDIAESTLDKTINKLRTIKEEKGKKREQAISFVNKTLQQAKERAIKQFREEAEEEEKREEEMKKLFGFNIKERIKQLDEEAEKKRKEEDEEEEEFFITPRKITVKIKKEKKSPKPKSPKPKKVKEEVKGEGFLADYFARKNYPPQSRLVLSQVGNEKIKNMTIARRPIDKNVFGSINLLTRVGTLGAFQNRFKNMPFDELYHLSLIITTESGNRILVEKNEVINISRNVIMTPDTQTEQIINLPTNLTIKELLDATEKRMGNNYYLYNAVRNNCQDFLMGILKANNIGDETDYKFIKQDVAELFKGFSKTEKVLEFATDVASVFDRLVKGNGIMYKNKLLIKI
jgi:hypothetical protein